MGILKQFFAYLRVSTVKQGEQGVSLQAQREAILRYAERHGIEIIHWFEERVTAAKRGRPVFAEMLRLLRANKAAGVIVHKIDRSARNLWDWAELGALIDCGIDVRFANEDLDMKTRGGRLSADIQAVVAADYVRNLREEAKKGIYGRLRQGIYPLPAPVGYLDQGAGKVKIPDAIAAPLVRRAFQLYDGGEVSMRTLCDELNSLGLRTRRGGRILVNALSLILRNPFYCGIIRIKRSGETFKGAHEPLISTALFDRVQARLDGKVRTQGWKHDYLFRRMLRCKQCQYTLSGERQKGHVYYRCHTSSCPTLGVREETVEDVLLQALELLRFSKDELEYARRRVAELRADWAQERSRRAAGINLRLSEVTSRLDRVTDAYVDRVIDQGDYLRRKEALIKETRDLEEKRADLAEWPASGPDESAEFLELVSSASLLYKVGRPAQRHTLVEILTSNCSVEGKTIELTLAPPFSLIAERQRNTNGGPYRDRLRTLDSLVAELVTFFRHDTKATEKLKELRVLQRPA
jgi:site-specific DNA recombinase